CPPSKGRLSTRYSPVRRFTRGANPSFSLDLHVLGLPLTFALSQDQTLHLNGCMSCIQSRFRLAAVPWTGFCHFWLKPITRSRYSVFKDRRTACGAAPHVTASSAVFYVIVCWSSRPNRPVSVGPWRGFS